jgi:hypothetical protein
MKTTFEQFLQEKHIEERAHLVPKDDLCDDFNDWICLDADEFIKLGQEWGDKEDKTIMGKFSEIERLTAELKDLLEIS